MVQLGEWRGTADILHFVVAVVVDTSQERGNTDFGIRNRNLLLVVYYELEQRSIVLRLVPSSRPSVYLEQGMTWFGMILEVGNKATHASGRVVFDKQIADGL